MNPWVCSSTRWISWIHQHIWRNSFVSDSTGSHKENCLGDYMEHKAIKRTILFSRDSRWTRDTEESSKQEFWSCPKVSLGAPLQRVICQQQRPHTYCDFRVIQVCSGDICDLCAGPDNLANQRPPFFYSWQPESFKVSCIQFALIYSYYINLLGETQTVWTNI